MSFNATQNSALLEEYEQRWRTDPRSLDEAWRAFFQGYEFGGNDRDLAHTETQIGVLRLVAKRGEVDALTNARATVSELERLDSPDELLKARVSVRKVFDRTSLILAIWLPVSRRAGGVPQATPNAPLLPAVTVG